MTRQWNFDEEWPKILAAATAHGVDPYAIAAIRVTENGSPGRDFGVLSTTAPDYASQLRVCCVSLRHRILEHGAYFFEYDSGGPTARLCLTIGFIKWFAGKWAPPLVANDPLNLNANWVKNFWTAYMSFVDEGGPIEYQRKRPV